MVFARLHNAPDAHLEDRDGLTSYAASAVRLLYAATQPLEESTNSQSYEQFYMSLGGSMREKLSIRDVIEFLRLALEVPAGEYLMLQPLFKQAHLATRRFGAKSGDKVKHITFSRRCRALTEDSRDLIYMLMET